MRVFFVWAALIMIHLFEQIEEHSKDKYITALNQLTFLGAMLFCTFYPYWLSSFDIEKPDYINLILLRTNIVLIQLGSVNLAYIFKQKLDEFN